MTQSISCPRCGTENLQPSKFCFNCGASLKVDRSHEAAPGTQTPPTKIKWNIGGIVVFVVVVWFILSSLRYCVPTPPPHP
jgi:uncharacterized membrane protein YvbJ